MLAGASLGDDTRLAHSLGQKYLSHGVINLVRPGMKEILAFQVNFCAPKIIGKPLGKIKRCRPATKFAQIIFQF